MNCNADEELTRHDSKLEKKKKKKKKWVTGLWNTANSRRRFKNNIVKKKGKKEQYRDKEKGKKREQYRDKAITYND